jgi:hypothetical protein
MSRAINKMNIIDKKNRAFACYACEGKVCGIKGNWVLLGSVRFRKSLPKIVQNPEKSQKLVDLMEQSPDEPNAGLEPAASRLEVSRATIALAGPLFTRLLEKRCDW